MHAFGQRTAPHPGKSTNLFPITSCCACFVVISYKNMFRAFVVHSSLRFLCYLMKSFPSTGMQVSQLKVCNYVTRDQSLREQAGHMMKIRKTQAKRKLASRSFNGHKSSLVVRSGFSRDENASRSFLEPPTMVSYRRCFFWNLGRFLLYEP